MMTERYGGGTESDKNLFCRVTGLMYNNSDNTFFFTVYFSSYNELLFN